MEDDTGNARQEEQRPPSYPPPPSAPGQPVGPGAPWHYQPAYQYLPPARRNAGAAWVIGGIAIVLVLLMMTFLCGTCFFIGSLFRGGYRGDGVALIEVQGLLTAGGDGGGLLGGYGTTSASLVEQVYEAGEDDRVKAILLRIDSPGGTPAAAEEVYSEIRKLSGEKPVVASIGDIGASGAYYIASACDWIIASPDSDVGSIGVIADVLNIQELNEKIGVSHYVFKEGEFKDIGSPYRPPTPEEAAIIQDQMRLALEHFIEDVAEGRKGKMTLEEVRALANGLTWPGSQALEMGLIDELGNFRTAVDKAGRMGGIEGEVTLIRMSSDSVFDLFDLLTESVKRIADNVELFGTGTRDSRPATVDEF